MDESKEEFEFEPLFDYSRVQPLSFVSLDDDLSDSENPLGLSPKRLKKSESESCTVVAPVVCDDKDEEDWLPPPPKTTTNDGRKIEQDATMKELRLKKQELASFAESAKDVLRAVEEEARKDVLRAVEEATRKELASSGQASQGPEVVKVSKPPDDRVKIVISIQDKEGLKQFRIYVDDKFERLFKMYAEKVNRDLESLVFIFDGDKVSATTTPNELGMEDDDILEVHTKSR